MWCSAIKGRFVTALNYGITVQDVISATSGHDITLVTENVFRNYRGSDAFAVSGGGYWRVYSTNPDLDTRGGLVYDFKQYDTAYGGTILGTGNGLIYTRAPTVTATLTGTVAKQYDGTRTANLLASNYTSVGGAIDGDTIHVNAASTGLYDTKDVGTGKSITVSGANSYNVTNGTRPVYGYRVTPLTAAVGSITKAPLSVTANNDTKQYDAVPYSGGNGVIYNGFVNSETSSVLGGTLTYSGTSQGAINVGDYTIIPGGLTSGNYQIAFVNGVLSIVERPLTLISGSLVGSVTRPYTGTTVATLTPANYQLTGWVGSDGATVTETVGTYSQANVGSNLLVTVALTRSDYTPTGTTDLLNYSLPTSLSGNIGSITQAPLTITASAFSRAYTGLAYSGGNGVTYSGFVNSETSAVLGGYAGLRRHEPGRDQCGLVRYRAVGAHLEQLRDQLRERPSDDHAGAAHRDGQRLQSPLQRASPTAAATASPTAGSSTARRVPCSAGRWRTAAPARARRTWVPTSSRRPG